ncbi:hypothetical protein PM082_008752 [Marasmius tenuissimus]|nr:hypothetical protein PM082_008752 [Marasmius tenuissimus]
MPSLAFFSHYFLPPRMLLRSGFPLLPNIRSPHCFRHRIFFSLSLQPPIISSYIRKVSSLVCSGNVAPRAWRLGLRGPVYEKKWVLAQGGEKNSSPSIQNTVHHQYLYQASVAPVFATIFGRPPNSPAATTTTPTMLPLSQGVLLVGGGVPALFFLVGLILGFGRSLSYSIYYLSRHRSPPPQPSTPFSVYYCCFFLPPALRPPTVCGLLSTRCHFSRFSPSRALLSFFPFYWIRHCSKYLSSHHNYPSPLHLIITAISPPNSPAFTLSHRWMHIGEGHSYALYNFLFLTFHLCALPFLFLVRHFDVSLLRP